MSDSHKKYDDQPKKRHAKSHTERDPRCDDCGKKLTHKEANLGVCVECMKG